MVRFLRRFLGRYVDNSQGYSVRLMNDNFPGMSVQYMEGPRRMDVFAEQMANLKDLDLYLRTIGDWRPPYDSEPVDFIQRGLILQRITTALKYLGYNVTTVGRLD